MLSICAWRGDHYVSLHELLDLIGHFFAECRWSVQVNEVAPEPGAELLEDCDSSRLMLLHELIRISAPNIQVIDGEITAIDNDGNASLLLRAVDSTSWDIETANTEALARVRESFGDAVEIPD